MASSPAPTWLRQTVPLAACILWSACANSSRPNPTLSPSGANDAGIASVHVRFDLGPGSAMTFGALPWPDDLYLDKQGAVALADFPESAPAQSYARSLLDSLSDLDGFGVSTPIYFFLDGDIDPATLPQTAEESTGDRASAFLIDADTGSPDAFQHVRVELQWFADTHRLAMRPAQGHPLVPGRRYAALVTRRVKDASGHPIGASPDFLAARDTTVATSDVRVTQARAEYTPVLATLIQSGAVREDIVGMAVFRVQNTSPDLDDARKLVRMGKPPVVADLAFINSKADLDGALGKPGSALAAPHDQLSAMVHGTLPSPNFVSATANTHGAWERDQAGALRVKRTDDVPFTLFVPSVMTGSSTPIVLYQHQLGHERSDAVFIANALGLRGIATLAIDAPFEGLRARPSDSGGSVDTLDRFTGAMQPDRFGDVVGDFFGVDEQAGGLTPLHPFYARDAIRQGVVDLMSVVRFLEEGDFGPIASKLSGRKFGAPRFGLIGEDVGAQMGILLATYEPNLQAVALVGAGAAIGQDWWASAGDQTRFAALAKLLGRDPTMIDYSADSPAFWPGLAIFDTLAGRAEPLAYSATFLRSPTNALMIMIDDDESVSNAATEALAVALGATFVSGAPRYVGDLGSDVMSPGKVVAGNFVIVDDHITRVLQSYDPADHALLLSAAASQNYVHPPDPPFRPLDPPTTFSNPHGVALDQVADYFASFFACVTAVNGSTSATQCEAAATVAGN